jgi:hypothetical protein
MRVPLVGIWIASDTHFAEAESLEKSKKTKGNTANHNPFFGQPVRLYSSNGKLGWKPEA